MNTREAIEYFHLLFSLRLGAMVDRNLFCLKGGCNLRFYFHSIRYSEDIDFDVHTTSVNTLKKNVEKVLASKAFHSVLKNSRNMELVEWSAPKQTETTQRWKVSLKVANQALKVPTKIEFSRRRSLIEGASIEAVDTQIIAGYKLQPLLLQHYERSKAIEQKISALIHRTETQARDVIDLHLLKNYSSQLVQIPLTLEQKNTALKTLMSLSFEDYKSQVWPYLLGEYQDHYGKATTWDKIQNEIVDLIEKQSESAK